MEGCGADYFIVVELAIFVAPPLDVEFSTEGGVVSLGDLVTVWMEDASEVFRSLDLPFGFRVWVFYPYASVWSFLFAIVGGGIVVVFVPFAFPCGY